MDQNQQGFEERKKEIELSLAKILLDELQKGTISYEQMREIARYILLWMEKIKINDELLKFIGNLTQKWSFFSNVLKVEQVKETEVKNEVKLESIRNYLLQLSNKTK